MVVCNWLCKTSHVYTAQNHRYTQEISMHSVSATQCELICISGGHFTDPVISWLREWHLWKAPAILWGTKFIIDG